MAGAAVKTDCVIAPSTWGYTDEVSYPYDPVKAKQLLTEAGYPNGFSAKIWTPRDAISEIRKPYLQLLTS